MTGLSGEGTIGPAAGSGKPTAITASIVSTSTLSIGPLETQQEMLLDGPATEDTDRIKNLIWLDSNVRLTDELQAEFVRKPNATSSQLAERTLERALRLLDGQERERYAEEWAADLLSLPSRRAQLRWALGLPIAALQLRWSSRAHHGQNELGR